MIGMKRLRVVIVVVIALVSAGCSVASAPSSSAGVATPPGPTSTALATNAASAPAVTPTPRPTPTPELAFRALDLPAGYTRASADAVDGTTAVGWVKVGPLDDELPAVWDTTTGALRVLDVPDEFVYANGETYVSLNGVSGTTAVGMGAIGTGKKRGQDRAMAWDTQTGDLRILDIPDGFTSSYTQTDAHAISGMTAVGEVWAQHGEIGAAVAWDTETGVARILEMPDDHGIGLPRSISGNTVVGGWTTTADDPQPLDLGPAHLRSPGPRPAPGDPGRRPMGRGRHDGGRLVLRRRGGHAAASDLGCGHGLGAPARPPGNERLRQGRRGERNGRDRPRHVHGSDLGPRNRRGSRRAAAGRLRVLRDARCQRSHDRRIGLPATAVIDGERPVRGRRMDASMTHGSSPVAIAEAN